MTKVFEELALFIVRVLVADLIRGVAVKFCTWLDTKIENRIAKLAIGGVLGLAAYFIFPLIMGLI